MNDQTKLFSVAPLSPMAPTYTRLDKVGLINSMEKIRAHLPNAVKPKEPERIANVIKCHARRNHDLGQNFQTDGTQVILNYIKIVEV